MSPLYKTLLPLLLFIFSSNTTQSMMADCEDIENPTRTPLFQITSHGKKSIAALEEQEKRLLQKVVKEFDIISFLREQRVISEVFSLEEITSTGQEIAKLKAKLAETQEALREKEADYLHKLLEVQRAEQELDTIRRKNRSLAEKCFREGPLGLYLQQCSVLIEDLKLREAALKSELVQLAPAGKQSLEIRYKEQEAVYRTKASTLESQERTLLEADPNLRSLIPTAKEFFTKTADSFEQLTRDCQEKERLLNECITQLELFIEQLNKKQDLTRAEVSFNEFLRTQGEKLLKERPSLTLPAETMSQAQKLYGSVQGWRADNREVVKKAAIKAMKIQQNLRDASKRTSS